MPRKVAASKKPVSRSRDAIAKKLCAAFAKALRLKRGWSALSDVERDAWRAVAQVQ